MSKTTPFNRRSVVRTILFISKTRKSSKWQVLILGNPPPGQFCNNVRMFSHVIPKGLQNPLVTWNPWLKAWDSLALLQFILFWISEKSKLEKYKHTLHDKLNRFIRCFYSQEIISINGQRTCPEFSQNWKRLKKKKISLMLIVNSPKKV